MMNTKKTYEADNISLNSDSINEAMVPNLSHLDTSTCYLRLMDPSSISRLCLSLSCHVDVSSCLQPPTHGRGYPRAPGGDGPGAAQQGDLPLPASVAEYARTWDGDTSLFYLFF